MADAEVRDAPNGDMKPSWRIRRRIVNSTLIFCALCVGKIIFWEVDSATAQVALYSLCGLSATVIGSYVFGAVWDDNGARKNGGR